MKKKTSLAIRLAVIIGIPLLFFGILEICLRIIGVDTEMVRSRSMKIVTPVWAANDINFVAAQGIYRGIIENTIPPRAAQWMKYFREAPHVRYNMKPDLDVRIINSVNKREIRKGIKVHIRSNSEGFRTSEIPKKKGGGVSRIAFIGDSTVFGWGVNQEERFSEIIETRLNQNPDGRRFETINLGIPGYTSHHALESYYCYALPYSPDMLIAVFGANDGKPISKRAKTILRRENRFESIRFFFLRFKTYQLFRKWLIGLANPFEKLMVQGKNRETEEKEAFVTSEEFRANLNALFDSAAAHHIRAACLSLCCPMEYMLITEQVCRERGLPFINGMAMLMNAVDAVREYRLYPEMARELRRLYGSFALEEISMLWVTNDTCHPNAVGHAVIADELLKRLEF